MVGQPETGTGSSLSQSASTIADDTTKQEDSVMNEQLSHSSETREGSLLSFIIFTPINILYLTSSLLQPYLSLLCY